MLPWMMDVNHHDARASARREGAEGTLRSHHTALVPENANALGCQLPARAAHRHMEVCALIVTPSEESMTVDLDERDLTKMDECSLAEEVPTNLWKQEHS